MEGNKVKKLEKHGQKFYAVDAGGKRIPSPNGFTTQGAAEARHDRYMSDLKKFNSDRKKSKK